MKNANTEYEKLAQEIYRTLNSTEDIQPIDIQHNIKIKGKSGCNHQIDVYWEFFNLGEKHCVAIECKNYSATIPIGKVRDFATVLDDIGDIKGIMVTKIGFQDGAKKIADQYGISLKVLRHPTDEDWKGRMKNLYFSIHMPFVQNKKRELIVDEKWTKSNYPSGTNFVFEGLTNEMSVVHKDGTAINSFYELECNLIDNKSENKTDVEKIFEFGDDAYIIDNENKSLKIKAIKYTYDIQVSTHKFAIEGDKIAKAILKDIKSGKRLFFNNSGQVHETT